MQLEQDRAILYSLFMGNNKIQEAHTSIIRNYGYLLIEDISNFSTNFALSCYYFQVFFLYYNFEVRYINYVLSCYSLVISQVELHISIDLPFPQETECILLSFSQI